MRNVFVAFAIVMSALVAPNAQQPTALPATPDNAAPFLGDWIISATGQYGPLTMGVSLKVAEGKIVGELTDQTGTHALSNISKVGNALTFGYVFDYQGMPIDASVTLSPNEKTIDAYVSMAAGAAQFSGTATKK